MGCGQAAEALWSPPQLGQVLPLRRGGSTLGPEGSPTTTGAARPRQAALGLAPGVTIAPWCPQYASV